MTRWFSRLRDVSIAGAANGGLLSYSNGVWGTKSGVVFVSQKSDFGEAVGGVITLEAGQTYLVTGGIDLTGDRLEAGGVVTLIGTSSETASITSTGLGTEVPLLTSRYTMPIRFITFKDVGTAIYFDDNAGANAPVALDWTGVNFNNVTTIGEIGTVENFIYSMGAFLNSQGLKFTGTIGTVGISDSLLQGDGSAANIISIESTAEITRRFRIIYSSVVSFGSAVGINASTSATIAVEGFILDTVNFSGGSTYVSGVQEDDNKSRWSECRGVKNSASISSYYMNGNVTATTIAAIGTAIKAAGATTSATISQRFTNSANRATYDGAIRRDFKVSAVLSVESGNNNVIGLYVAKNGALIPESEVYITTNAGGRAEAGMCQVIIPMAATDYIEVFVENDTSTSSITVTELNVIVEALN